MGGEQALGELTAQNTLFVGRVAVVVLGGHVDGVGVSRSAKVIANAFSAGFVRREALQF